MITFNRPVKIALAISAVIVFSLLSFGFGVRVGAHKARFTENWYEGYRKDFMGPKSRNMMPPLKKMPPMMGDMMNDADLLQSNSAAGVVVSVNGNVIVVKTIEGVEKTILVDNKTAFRKFREDVKITDITVGSEIVAIGSSDESGKIIPILVRVMR